MSITVIILIMIVMGIGITILHELSHALAADVCGFNVKGYGYDKQSGLRVTTKVTYPADLSKDPNQNWKLLFVSAAGIMFHFLCMVISIYLLPTSEVNNLFFLLNLGSFIANLLPLKGSDGQKIYMVLFKYQLKGLGAFCEPNEKIYLAELKG